MAAIEVLDSPESATAVTRGGVRRLYAPALLQCVTLLLSCLASYLIVSDIAMVNVALPSIADAMGFSQLQQLWFVSCYVLLVGGLAAMTDRD